MSDYVGDNKWIPKEEGPQAASERIVWSTKQINDLLVAMDQGYRPKIKLPFYEGRQFLKKGNIVFEYTDEEIAELARCAADIVYFAEKYAVVMTDNGIQKVKLRDYQIEMLRNFQDERFNIVLASRQMGKTVTASIFNAWYLTFNMDKNTLLLANKSDSTKEIIDKINRNDFSENNLQKKFRKLLNKSYLHLCHNDQITVSEFHIFLQIDL